MSKTSIRPPYISMLIYTVVISLIIYVISRFYPDLVYQHIEYVMVFFYFTFLMTYLVAQLSFSNVDPKKAVTLHLGATVFRLIFSLIAAFIFIKLDPENSRVFVGNFLVIYLFYLVFEIYSLLSNLRPDLKSKE